MILISLSKQRIKYEITFVPFPISKSPKKKVRSALSLKKTFKFLARKRSPPSKWPSSSPGAAPRPQRWRGCSNRLVVFSRHEISTQRWRDHRLPKWPPEDHVVSYHETIGTNFVAENTLQPRNQTVKTCPPSLWSRSGITLLLPYNPNFGVIRNNIKIQ